MRNFFHTLSGFITTARLISSGFSGWRKDVKDFMIEFRTLKKKKLFCKFLPLLRSFCDSYFYFLMITKNIKNNPNQPKFGLLLKMIYGICIEALNLWINLWLLKGFPNGPLPIAMNRLYWQDTLNFSVFHQTHNEVLSVLVKSANKGIFNFL